MPWNLSEKGFWQYQNKHGTYGCRDAPFRFKNRIIRGRRQRLMYKLVLLRHGESVWNKENRFTGWIDVGLSEKGVEEAKESGRVLAKEGFVFDVAYTSVLKRAIKTLWLALEEMDLMWLPIHHSWRLNERHYGGPPRLHEEETGGQDGPGEG